MCSTKTIYKAANNGFPQLERVKRGGKMNFKEVFFATNCIRILANRKEKSMAEVVEDMKAKEAFQTLYKLIKQEEPKLTERQVVNRLEKMLLA